MRVPSFSTDRLLSLNESISQRDIKAIKATFNDTFFLNAIYFSSRYFHKVVLEWLKKEDLKFDKEDSVLISLYKYYIRICTRSTPYGLFAGFASGNVANKTQIEFKEKMYSPILRPDILFKKKINTKIIEENLNKNMLFYPNNTIYDIGEELRYIEWDSDFNYEISKVENNFMINNLLKKSILGLTFNELKKIIQDELPDVNKNEVITYIKQLIQSKILVNKTPPYITSGINPLKESKDYFKKLGINTTKIDEITRTVSKQEEILDVDNIEKLAFNNRNIIGDKTQVFQVDTKLNLDKNSISQSIVNSLTQDAKSILEINKPYQSQRIINFCRSFYNKFENNEISLVKALDPQLGVGYDFYKSGNIEESPLLNNIEFSYSNNESNNQTIPPIINLILKKYLQQIVNKTTIRLTKDDLKEISNPIENSYLCDDYCLFGDLICDSFKELDKGNFKFHTKASIPSPYSKALLSRFAYHDKELERSMNSISDENKEFIYAEVVHCPTDRFGNVSLRPNFFNYEIPYTSPGINSDKVKININDILVAVKGDNVLLKSKSCNKIIIPRFSNAYNYELSQLSVIKFFCDLQYHNKYIGLNWDWSILKESSFLPRVEYSNIILKEARWKLDKNTNADVKYLKNQFKELEISKYCTLKEGDNVLVLDLENDISINIILKHIKRGSLYLYELIDNKGIAKSNQGNHRAEFILPIAKEEKRSVIKPNVNNKTKQGVGSDKFLPSKEWTYFKIYCSHGVADKIISDVLEPIMRKEKKLSFFIRYSDPENHLRFRIKSNHIGKLSRLLTNKINSFTKVGFVNKIQIDTYKREIERYGSNNIDLTEEFFHYDSIATAEFIKSFSDYDEELRWKIALISLDLLLDSFNINITERFLLFSELYDGFLPEFVNTTNKIYTKKFKQSIDKKVRDNKDFLDNALRLKIYSPDISTLITPYQIRTRKIEKNSNIIKNNFSKRKDFLDVMKSYIHMSLNRIFESKVRMHELVIYFFMLRQYNSIIKRNEKKHNTNSF